jgi:hypothetical protein
MVNEKMSDERWEDMKIVVWRTPAVLAVVLRKIFGVKKG